MTNAVNNEYLATSTYIYAYFRQQHPALMHWTQLLAGIEPTKQSDLPHLELGFGQGLGLAITAASNDAQQVGVDFMAEQVDNLRELMQNTKAKVVLHQSDFATFLITNKQHFQSMSLHGVWSWVSAETRAQIAAIIDQFLIDDGVVYISHNCLPGRAALQPVQRLIHHTAQMFSEQDDSGLNAALAVLGSDLPVSRYAQQTPTITSWWHSLSTENPRYLAHEYLGNAWHPMLFSDMAHSVSTASLKFACSADAIELLTDIHLTSEQQAWLNVIPDINLKQSYQDLLRNTGFRRDLWRKQIRFLSATEQSQQIANQALVLLHPLVGLSKSMSGDLGEFELPQPYTEQMLIYLASAQFSAKKVFQIQDNLSAQQLVLTTEQIKAILIALTGLGYIHPAQTLQSNNVENAQNLNRALCAYAWQDNRIGYLASPLAGCGIQVSRLQQLFLLAYEATKTLEVTHWASWLWLNREKAIQPFTPSELNGDAANVRWLTTQADAFKEGRFALLSAHQSIVAYS